MNEHNPHGQLTTSEKKLLGVIKAAYRTNTNGESKTPEGPFLLSGESRDLLLEELNIAIDPNGSTRVIKYFDSSSYHPFSYARQMAQSTFNYLASGESPIIKQLICGSTMPTKTCLMKINHRERLKII